MRYIEKKILPGCTIIYLHNSDECYNCQQALKSDIEVEKIKKSAHKKKTSLKGGLSYNLEKFFREVQEKLKKRPQFAYPVPVKPHSAKSLKKIKVLKRTNSDNVNSKLVKTLPLENKKQDFKIVKPVTKAAKNKTIIEKKTKSNSVKIPCNSEKKVKGSKIPGKGTLKRKRWFINKLNDTNENYEDDLFENRKFSHLQSLLDEDETDNSEKYEDLKTPVFPFSISPRETTPSPTYKDCYSPTQLSIRRKDAQEYQYRRRKRRKQFFSENKEETRKIDTKSREIDVQKRLEEVARLLKAHKAQNEKASDSEEDQYFSDVIDGSCQVNT